MIDQSIFRTATSLPAWADSRSTTGGLRIYVPKTDNLFVPHNGYMFSVGASGGNKKIFKNADAPETIYQNIDFDTYVASFISEISLFKPIAGALHLMGNTRLGFIEAPKLFENDLFLLGGLHTLRGFDEKSMAASCFNVNTPSTSLFVR